MGSRMVVLGRGGAAGVVQFFDKVVDVPVVALGTFVVAVPLLERLLTCPLRSLLGFVFFFGVKGVVDVLAGLVTCSSLVSRASVTCLLGFEQGVDVFFFGVKGVGDVLAGVEQGVEEFAVVKGVGDVLAGRGAWC